MEISKYMNLPMQTSERTVIGREKIRRVLLEDFERIYPKIKLKNAVKLNNDLILHIRIPSEVFLDNLYYDVVLRFLNSADKGIDDKTHIQFYSNSPAFLFTFAYVYNANGLLYDRMINKAGSFALKNPPVRTNPKRILGLEKSIYFAVEFLKRSGLHKNTTNFSSGLTKIMTDVISSDAKLDEYKTVKEKFKDKYTAYKNNTPKFSFS